MMSVFDVEAANAVAPWKEQVRPFEAAQSAHATALAADAAAHAGAAIHIGTRAS